MLALACACGDAPDDVTAPARLNSVRIYTLHYPRFYEALRAYNLAHREHPIYVFQGIWLDEDNPSRDLYELTGALDASIEEVIDCAHGRRTIGERFGRAAYGEYTADISPWVMGYIIGREVHPREVLTTDELHASATAFDGVALRVAAVNPASAWVTARLDKAIAYERDAWGTERPVSFSSWPTLDPLHHPTESGAEDAASLDLAHLDSSGAPAGYFATYHAYPYYPEGPVGRRGAMARGREGLGRGARRRGARDPRERVVVRVDPLQ